MGDIFRIAYERSFFCTDDTLMRWLWQQSYGSLWILGRALLTLYRWSLLGGLLVAFLLTAGSWLVGYCLRLPLRWRWVEFLPAGAWMTWVAWSGLDLYFQHEPGRILGIPFLAVLVCAIDAFIIWTFKASRPHKTPVVHTLATGKKGANALFVIYALVLVCCFALPMTITHLRHPYARPLTRMEVQMIHQDWEGMSATAHEYAELSYRPLAAYYTIALIHTGHLTDALFDIRLDYDSLYIHRRNGEADTGTDYYLIDCDYHAGLFRPARHKAIEQMTMDGPTIYTLKHLTRLELIDHNWPQVRKYLRILERVPFEGDFISKYGAMVKHPDLVEADAEIALLRKTEPVVDAFESQFQDPVFLGYNADLTAGRSLNALMLSLMANLYSKRMPAFLLRVEPLIGSTPPRTIAEGLVTQSPKNEAIMKAFPMLKMEGQRYMGFLQSVQPYMKDRAGAGKLLFDQYKGYYPYYYFFGNLKATRKSTDKEHGNSKAGVN